MKYVFQSRGSQQHLSSEDQAAISELNLFQKLVFFPLKIQIDVDLYEFLNYFDRFKQDIITFNTKSKWVGIKPISGPHITSEFYKIDQGFEEAFPLLIPQIKKQLPLREIHMLHFWEQNVLIGDHQDGGAADINYFFPASYRIMLIKSKQPAFYVKPILGINSLPFISGKDQLEIKTLPRREFIKMPANSNVFCFNNSACKHGSIIPGDRKIIGFLDAEIDFVKHLELLKQSIKIYPDDVIYKN